ncbi:MAG: CoA transferase [Nocardioides sp.]|uniref:CoA transferase n=1 Tax=Nocardioides sp. TaxID=35761 RepID=UPI0039E4454A
MTRAEHDATRRLLRGFLAGLDLPAGYADEVTLVGDGSLHGYVGYTDVLAASLAAAALAVAELMAASGGERPAVSVDRRLVTGWAGGLLQPVGARPRSASPFRIGGEYPTADGRHLRITDANQRLQDRMLAVLGTGRDLAAIRAEIARSDADGLEDALLAGGGAAAASRSVSQWAAHPAGRAVAAEPLVAVETRARGGAEAGWQPSAGRPLAGIRVLDCTRAVAGPMATRLLAGFGAEVLRIDPPGYEEWADRDPTQLTLGKRCARLDLTSAEGRERFLELLSEADVFVHGFRPGVFEELGLGERERAAVRPDLVEVTHNAYGWTGPWAGRRGFDSTVFTSSGLLVESMRRAGTRDVTAPGIVQHVIVDHCVGHVDAAAAVRGLTRRMLTGQGSRSRLSLAGNARFLADSAAPQGPWIELPLSGPYEDRVVSGVWGPVRRLDSPVLVEGAPFFWERPGERYGSATASWSGRR